MREQLELEQKFKLKSCGNFQCTPKIFFQDQNPKNSLEARAQNVDQVHRQKWLPSVTVAALKPVEKC